MRAMFMYATSFTSDLRGWDVENVKDVRNFDEIFEVFDRVAFFDVNLSPF